MRGEAQPTALAHPQACPWQGSLVLDKWESVLKYMTNGGTSVQAVKCPQCRAPLDMPASGNLVKRSYCGGTVYAPDITDRVRQLTG